MIHADADGRGDEPNWLIMHVVRKERVEISTGDTTYIHNMRGAIQILGKAIGKPAPLQYEEGGAHGADAACAESPEGYGDVLDLMGGSSVREGRRGSFAKKLYSGPPMKKFLTNGSTRLDFADANLPPFIYPRKLSKLRNYNVSYGKRTDVPPSRFPG